MANGQIVKAFNPTTVAHADTVQTTSNTSIPPLPAGMSFTQPANWHTEGQWATQHTNNNMWPNGALVQWETTKYALKDSTGHIYPAGTLVSRMSRKNDPSSLNDYNYSMCLNISNEFMIDFSHVLAKDVNPLITKTVYSVSDSNYWATKLYVTDAAKNETLILANSTTVQKNGLQAIIQQVGIYMNDSITQDSKNQLSLGITQGNAILNNPNATQIQVNNATTNINNIIHGVKWTGEGTLPDGNSNSQTSSSVTPTSQVSSKVSSAVTPVSQASSKASSKASSVVTPVSQVSSKESSALTPISQVSSKVSSALTPISQASSKVSSKATTVSSTPTSKVSSKASSIITTTSKTSSALTPISKVSSKASFVVTPTSKVSSKVSSVVTPSSKASSAVRPSSKVSSIVTPSSKVSSAVRSSSKIITVTSNSNVKVNNNINSTNKKMVNATNKYVIDNNEVDNSIAYNDVNNQVLKSNQTQLKNHNYTKLNKLNKLPDTGMQNNKNSLISMIGIGITISAMTILINNYKKTNK